MQSEQAKDIDQYIANFPENVQESLFAIRALISKLVPGATETINYQIPTFKLNGKNLVHFAGYDKHIGFYPGASGIANFEKELSSYKHAKGSVQFPLSQPVPFELIEKIVTFRMQEELQKKKK